MFGEARFSDGVGLYSGRGLGAGLDGNDWWLGGWARRRVRGSPVCARWRRGDGVGLYSSRENIQVDFEIVPGKSRTSMYALDKSCESVVRLLAQDVYGYRPIDKGSSASKEIATDRGNVASMAKALYTSIGVSMALCCLIYSFLYSTYPRDRERAQMEALIESKMLQIRLELPADGQHPHQVLLSESGEPYLEERTVIEPEKRHLIGLASHPFFLCFKIKID